MEMVFIKTGFVNEEIRYPKDYEVVKIIGQCLIYPNSFDVRGYETSFNGTPQSICKRHFRPLSEILDKISIAELVEEVEHA